MTLDEMFQSAVDMPQYKLVESARNNIGIVLEFFEDYTGKKQSAIMLMTAIGTFVAADGKVSAAEYQFMQSVLHTDMDYDTFFTNAVVGADEDLVRSIDNIIDMAPNEVKASFLALCLDFIACDGEITPEEKRLLIKYLN